MITSILERWIEQGPQGDAIDDARRTTLDVLVAATQRRQPVVADLAREVRFGIVDEPRLRAIRDTQYEAMERPPRRPGRRLPKAGPQGDHMGALVECPQPLAPLLLRHLASTRPRPGPSCWRR